MSHLYLERLGRGLDQDAGVLDCLARRQHQADVAPHRALCLEGLDLDVFPDAGDPDIPALGLDQFHRVHSLTFLSSKTFSAVCGRNRIPARVLSRLSLSRSSPM